MRGRDCKPVLCRPQMVRILFTANRNLSVFGANTKITGCARCLLIAPGVLCSPQVRKKLINHVPLTRRMPMVQRVSSALVYTKLYVIRELRNKKNLWKQVYTLVLFYIFTLCNMRKCVLYATCIGGFTFFIIIGHRISRWDPDFYQNVANNALYIFPLKTENFFFLIKSP